jgi:hypothetical protein
MHDELIAHIAEKGWHRLADTLVAASHTLTRLRTPYEDPDDQKDDLGEFGTTKADRRVLIAILRRDARSRWDSKEPPGKPGGSSPLSRAATDRYLPASVPHSTQAHLKLGDRIRPHLWLDYRDVVQLVHGAEGGS